MEENSFHLLVSALKNDVDLEYIKNILHFVKEKQLFESVENGKLSELVHLINDKLHSSRKSRLNSLSVLNELLPKCPPDIYAENSLFWMQQCIKLSTLTVNEELRILPLLFAKSAENPDLRKQVSNTIIPQFVDRLHEMKTNSKLTVLLKVKCTESLMHNYGSVCGGTRKSSLERFVVNSLNCYAETDEIVNEASKCIVALCCCGNKGGQGIMYKESWTRTFNSLIRNSTKLLQDIYSCVDRGINCEEMCTAQEDSNSGDSLKELTVLDEKYEQNSISRFYGLKLKFRVLSKVIRAMLLCKFPVNKCFNPNALLNLICCTLAVTYKTLENRTTNNDVLALSFNVCDLHVYAFDVLRSLIISAQRNIILYGTLICKLCVQALKWTNFPTCEFSSTKCFQAVRRKAYAVLSTWLSAVTFSSSIEVFSDEIIPIILSDVNYCKPDSIALIANDKRKRKDKKWDTAFDDVKTTSFQMNAYAHSEKTGGVDKETCRLAHRTLRLILTSSSVLIKWEHHKNMQTVVLNQVLEILKTNDQSKYVAPYNDFQCRLQLLKTLHTIIKEPHPKWSIPISHALNVFRMGLRIPCVKMSEFCKNAVNSLELIIHPKGETLYFTNENHQLFDLKDDRRLFNIEKDCIASEENAHVSTNHEVNAQLIQNLNSTDNAAHLQRNQCKKQFEVKRSSTAPLQDQHNDKTSKDVSTERNKPVLPYLTSPKIAEKKFDETVTLRPDAHNPVKEANTYAIFEENKPVQIVKVSSDTVLPKRIINDVSDSHMPSIKKVKTDHNSDLNAQNNCEIEMMISDFVDVLD